MKGRGKCCRERAEGGEREGKGRDEGGLREDCEREEGEERRGS